MKEISNQWNPELYNEKHSFVYGYGEDLVKSLNPKSNELILDLGCGSGQLTSKIAELAKKVIGIDSSVEMVKDAQKKFPNIEFQVANATNFGFEEKFDAIFSNATLHWVKNYQAAIQCMYENLKPTGKIVAEFGGKGNIQTILQQLKSSLRKRKYLKQAKTNLWYFPSIGEYSTELEKVGFRVILAQHYDRPTELADENTGITDWLSMFGKSFFVNIQAEQVEEIKKEVQEMVRTQCFINGKWFADYKRIRVVAIKEK